MSHSGRRPNRDTGTATVEFVLVGLLMMVPIAYGLLTALQVQRTAFAAVEAAGAAARAFITAPSGSAALQRAQQAMDFALRDQGVPAPDGQLRITCTATPCLTPGGTVRVEVSSTAHLGGLPPFLGGEPGGTAGIPVQAVHVETVDPFEPGRP